MDSENTVTEKKFESEIGEKPPVFSFGLLFASIQRRGLIETLNDEALGPHTHLLLLLSIVFLIAIIIGLIQPIL